jgi:hypothetical protein
LCSRGTGFLVQLPVFLLAISGAVPHCLALCAGLKWLLRVSFESVTTGTLVCGY